MKPPTVNKLNNKIFAVTGLLQKEYPAQYRLLEESPLFHFGAKGEVSPVDFQRYLETLKTQLASFRKGKTVNHVNLLKNCVRVHSQLAPTFVAWKFFHIIKTNSNEQR